MGVKSSETVSSWSEGGVDFSVSSVVSPKCLSDRVCEEDRKASRILKENGVTTRDKIILSELAELQ